MRVVIAFGAGMILGGCVVELDHVLACGDGYIDELAGEECEPNVPESFEDGCVGTNRPFGNARCDPDTCEIVATELQCARCGDELVDVAAGEECDGSNNGARCPNGETPACSATTCMIVWESCGPCGNAVRDEGEECDWADVGGLAVKRACGGDDPLEPYRLEKPYMSGSSATCTETCEYDRRGCGYCGDGVQDPALPVGEDALSWPELCDGDDFDELAVADAYPECAAMGARPDVVCDDDCLGFALRDENQLPCPELKDE